MKTSNEKAIELVDKFREYTDGDDPDNNYRFSPRISKENAKKCALIAVDEIIDTLNYDIRDLDVRGSVLLDLITYWSEVKKEIEKL